MLMVVVVVVVVMEVMVKALQTARCQNEKRPPPKRPVCELGLLGSPKGGLLGRGLRAPALVDVIAGEALY